MDRGRQRSGRSQGSCRGGNLREELEEHATEKLADYKRPKHIFFVEDLPRNAAGKILKRELREEFADKAASRRE